MSDGKDHGLADNGTRVQSVTGATREDATEKGRFDLLPYEPLRRLAVHYERGAKKYGDRNWEKGLPLHGHLSCGARHLMKFIGGHRDEDHLAAVLWNVCAYIATEKWIDEGKLPEAFRTTVPHSLSAVAQTFLESVEKELAKTDTREARPARGAFIPPFGTGEDGYDK
jgi:hypothetical protein